MEKLRVKFWSPRNQRCLLQETQDLTKSVTNLKRCGKVDMPLAFSVPLKQTYVFEKEGKIKVSFVTLFWIWIMTSKWRNVSVMSLSVIERMFRMLNVSLLPQTELDSARSDKIWNKKCAGQEDLRCIWCSFIRILCWVIFPMVFAASGERSAYCIHHKLKYTCSDMIFFFL